MANTLEEIAQQLKDANKKVQLIYAFNGTGKTRLSRAFKDIISPPQIENENGELVDNEELTRRKIIYYNAFTEDLFHWDNDLKRDKIHKLKIQPNSFTDWILKEQGKGGDIVTNFQNSTSNKITPVFNAAYSIEEDDGKKVDIPENSEITFRLNPSNIATEDTATLINEGGDTIVTEQYEIVKISKGEESNFVWSVFYTLLEQIISILNVAEPADRETDQFNQLEYVFIDDPVSSLDENHLIQLAVSLATLIKSSKSGLKFIITTHNPLFYNVLYSELDPKNGLILNQLEDGTFELENKKGDSNKSFSYHLYLKNILEKAIAENQVEKYHFTLLRNLYEKTANFLGYEHWTKLLETARGDKDAYYKRIITFSSHRTLSNEEIANPTPQEKQTVKILLDNLIENYAYWKPRVETNA